MPLITMYLKFKDGQMRHVMRYNHQPDIGIIYTGDGDQAYLERWCLRTALNLGSHSLGVFSASCAPDNRIDTKNSCEKDVLEGSGIVGM